MHKIKELDQLNSISGGFETYVSQFANNTQCYIGILAALVFLTLAPGAMAAEYTGSTAFGIVTGLSTFAAASYVINEI